MRVEINVGSIGFAEFNLAAPPRQHRDAADRLRDLRLKFLVLPLPDNIVGRRCGWLARLDKARQIVEVVFVAGVGRLYQRDEFSIPALLPFGTEALGERERAVVSWHLAAVNVEPAERIKRPEALNVTVLGIDQFQARTFNRQYLHYLEMPRFRRVLDSSNFDTRVRPIQAG
jgi:hypothetical protein